MEITECVGCACRQIIALFSAPSPSGYINLIAPKNSCKEQKHLGRLCPVFISLLYKASYHWRISFTECALQVETGGSRERAPFAHSALNRLHARSQLAFFHGLAVNMWTGTFAIDCFVENFCKNEKLINPCFVMSHISFPKLLMGTCWKTDRQTGGRFIALMKPEKNMRRHILHG